jgi:hypothetical protein
MASTNAKLSADFEPSFGNLVSMSYAQFAARQMVCSIEDVGAFNFNLSTVKTKFCSGTV